MSTWSRVRSGWMAALATLLVSGEAQAAATEEALLIVDGAQDLFRIPRSAVARQISYTIDLEYPARAIGEPQWDQLRKTGWTRCQSVHPEQEAANADWVSFIDGTVQPERTIHQHLTHWSRDDQMIMIGLRYSSARRATHEQPGPDNEEQHVHLVFDDEYGREIAAALELVCGQ